MGLKCNFVHYYLYTYIYMYIRCSFTCCDTWYPPPPFFFFFGQLIMILGDCGRLSHYATVWPLEWYGPTCVWEVSEVEHFDKFFIFFFHLVTFDTDCDNFGNPSLLDGNSSKSCVYKFGMMCNSTCSFLCDYDHVQGFMLVEQWNLCETYIYLRVGGHPLEIGDNKDGAHLRLSCDTVLVSKTSFRENHTSR